MADPVGKTILQLEMLQGEIDRSRSYIEIHVVGQASSARIALTDLAARGLSAKEVIQETHPEIQTDEQFIAFISGTNGKSAYEVAVAAGFGGTQTEWLASLKGTNGTNGSNGKSAYDIAVDEGFVGNKAAWLLSLKGAKGDTGTAGTNGTDGTNGEDGTNGVDGKSAYQIAVDGGFVGTEAQWVASLKGAKGTDGTNGKSSYQLAQDAGFVGNEAAYLASLKGDQGDVGDVGAAGKSAYEVAVAGGFVGTEAQWLLSLKGIQGDKGTDGTNGTNGQSAYELAVEAGFEGDETEFLLSLNGKDGDKGDTGAAGQSAFQIAAAGGFVGTVEEWVASLDGKSAYQSARDQGFVGTEAAWVTSLKGAKGDTGPVKVIGQLQGALSSMEDLPPVEEYADSDYFFVDGHVVMNVGSSWTDLGKFEGPAGKDGLGITILGSLANSGQLPPSGNMLGDTYLIGKSMWVWQGTLWQEQGQEGLRGPEGPIGPEGKNSFEVVRSINPEVDTIEKYVEFIRGGKGDKGDTAVSFVTVGVLAATGDLPASAPESHGYLVGNDETDYEFHVYVAGQWVNLGNDHGPQGERGVQGEQGPIGRAMTPKGTLASTDLLPGAGNVVGDYYGINGHFYAWGGDTWVDLGTFVGAKGDQGEQGETGAAVTAKGQVATVGDLPTSGNVKGDAYEITGDLHVYDGAAFVNMGSWRGLTGPEGKSAYQSALDGGFVGNEAAWRLSLKGDKGDTGDVGEPGKPMTFIGPLANEEALPDDAAVADAYLIGETFYVWNGTVWKTFTALKGADGTNGTNGKSIYDIAVEGGFQGDEAAFLLSLKGTNGTNGTNGKTVYEIAVQEGFVGTEAEFLLTLKGTNGTNGKSTYQIAVDGGFVGDEAAWLLSIKGAKGDTGDKGEKGDTGDTGTPGSPMKLIGTLTDMSQLPGNPAVADAYMINESYYVWNGTEWQVIPALKGIDGRSINYIGNFANQAALPNPGVQSEYASAGGRVYIHNGEEWVDAGAVGVQGVKGDTGAEGKSAYEVAVAGGFVGDVTAWLASLKGNTGATGKSLYQDAVDNNLFVGTLPEFVASQKGEEGMSAFEQAIADGKLPPDATIDDFLALIKGDQGDIGLTGPTGPAISIIGQLATSAELPATGVTGTGYAIPDANSPGTFDCWIWLSETNQWFNLGHMVGSQGPRGDIGPRGLQGLKGEQGIQGSLWIVFPRQPQAQDGRIGDYFYNSASQEFFRKLDAVTWVSQGHIGGGNLNAPSNDGKHKTIKDGAWVDAPLLNSIPAADGRIKVLKDGAWVDNVLLSTVPASNGKFKGVKDGAWAELPALVNNLPADATGVYQLVNGAWVKFDVYTLKVLEIAIAANAATFDWNLARQFRINNNTTGTKAISMTNIPASDRAASVVVKVYGKTAAFSWSLDNGKTIRWADGVVPPFTNDITTVVFNWDGFEMVGFVPN